MNIHDALVRLEQAIAKVGTAQQFAARYQISPAYLSDVRGGRRGLGPKICAAIGITLDPPVYRKIKPAPKDTP